MAGGPLIRFWFGALAGLAALVAALGWPAVATAHSGPPFPIIMDQPAGERTVSVWADPDVGTGSFFVLIEGDASLPEPQVRIWVQPVSERLPKVTYEAQRQALRGRVQFAAYPEFDQQEMWRVGIVVEPPEAAATELVTQVEPTPDGLSPGYVAAYVFPFLLLAGMWAAALIRRWRQGRQAPPAGASGHESGPTLEQSGEHG